MAKISDLIVRPGHSLTSKDRLEAIAINNAKCLGYDSLKEKQLEAVVSPSCKEMTPL